MPATFPSTRPESRAEGLEKKRAQAGGDREDCNAPQFLLLDTSGPHPGALVLSFASLSALLILTVVVSHSLSATRSPRTEFFSEIVAPTEPLWLPPNPPAVNPHEKPTPRSEPDEQIKEAPPPPAAPDQPAEAAKADPLPQPRLAVLPLPSSDVVSPALKLAPFRTAASQTAPSAPRISAPETLGTLPLPRLLDRETALAAGFAALTPEQRLALPRVSIRVNAEWLEALPETQERLYFSLTTPLAGVPVLAYSPATQTFTLERPLRPLWQIRDGERVPSLAALRAAAARRLGASPELVGLYTWHPPELENALRMFVLARMEQMGVHLGPRDVVTVRLASGTGGFVMNLEPLRAAVSW
jgi:hypothetical protein